jgi:YbbR domain-containing protein
MNFLRAIGNLLRFDRANWKAVILCFIVAIVFWLFNAFNKTYSTNVRFPLRFEYDAENFIPVHELPRQVTVNVSGNGWELFRSHFGIKLPELAIALEHPLETKKIVGATLLPQLEPQLGKLKINYVVTDTLHLKIDERDAHLFKVTVDTKNLRFKEGYGLISPIVLLPDSISVDGPKSVLHELPDSLSLLLDDEGISENFSKEIEVSVPSGVNLNRNPSLVKVMFEVGRVSTLSFALKWSRDRQPDATDSVRITVMVPIRQETEVISLHKQWAATGKRVRNKKVIPARFNLPPYVRIVEIDSVTNE